MHDGVNGNSRTKKGCASTILMDDERDTVTGESNEILMVPKENFQGKS